MPKQRYDDDSKVHQNQRHKHKYNKSKQNQHQKHPVDDDHQHYKYKQEHRLHMLYRILQHQTWEQDKWECQLQIRH